MSLDVFDSTIRNSDAEVAANAAPDLPAGFGDAFDASLRYAGEWNNSLAYSTARQRALASSYDDVQARTGVQLPLYDMGGNVSLDDLNEAIAKLPQDPNQPEPTYTPLSEGSIDAMTLRRMAAAHQDAAAMSAREKTWGGTFGNIAGNVIGSLSDPVQDAMLPLGGAGEVGVGLRALEFAGIGAGSEALTAAASGSSRERAVPGSSSEIPGEIAGAGLFGAGLGGAFGLLGKWLGAGRGVLPTSLRDDVNAGTSEAQLNASNVFPGAAAENANRDAVTDAVRSAVNGDPVTAGDRFIEAYHGSPHDFDQFDISRIGTGEGGQSFGHGLYFAQEKNVAAHYATALSSSPGPLPETVKSALKDIDYAGFDSAGEAISNIRAHQGDWTSRWSVDDAEAEQTINKYIQENPRGNIYQVRIDADPDTFLDWDKPLGEQPKMLDLVKQAVPQQGPVAKLIDEIATGGIKGIRRELAIDPDRPGSSAYGMLSRLVGGDEKATDLLRSAGVPGIKYLDAGSRGADEAAATRNYVVFNHGDVHITHKNGLPLSPAEMADAQLHPITLGEAPDVENFDRVPEAGEDAASYWEDRLESATPEERRALGATDARPGKFTFAQRPDDGSDTKKFDIRSPDGDLVGEAKVTIKGSTARIDDIRTTGPNGEFKWIDDSANTLGPKAMRDLLRQFQEEHPEISELTGLRISGARDTEKEISVPLSVSAPDLSPEAIASLAEDPQLADVQAHDLGHLLEQNPDMEFTTQTRLDDGSYRLDSRPLKDVLAEIGEEEAAAKELQACVIGMEAAAE